MRTALDISVQDASRGRAVAPDERRSCAGFIRPKGVRVVRDGDWPAQFCKRELRCAAIAIDVTVEEVIAFADPPPKRERAPTTSAVDHKVRGANGVSRKLQSAEFPDATASAIDWLAEKQHG